MHVKKSEEIIIVSENLNIIITNNQKGKIIYNTSYI